ncbi:histone-lysine N-methyltransferase SMYD3 isoform X2 [Hetaerina americana]|uniref:histone-lysine N-methyltransferase SMYD3 isoform X2 n=1 Tax=Hetaerina americana TaxID=62018 RepID=UPI003A7F5DBB
MKTAASPVKKGSTLMVAKPFVYILLAKFQGKHCDSCLKSVKVLKCSGCQFVHYCGRSCQTKAWKEHKEECMGMRRIKPHTLPDASRMMAKLIMKLKGGGDQEKNQITSTWSRRFKDLMSHYSDIKIDKTRMEHFESLCHILIEFFGDEYILPNTAEMLGIYGRLCVNCFNILDGEMSCIGAGVYLAPSIIDHSCKPNAVVTFDGPTLYVRSLVDFPSLDWKKVFISYVDLLSIREDRRKELQRGYYFWCECERCVAGEKGGTNGYYLDDAEKFASTLACPNDKCPNPIFMAEKHGGKPPSCKSCGYNLSEEMIEQHKEASEISLEKIRAMGSTAYLDVCQVLLRKQESTLFHPLNILHVKTLDLAFDSAIQMQCWEDVLIFGRKLLPGYRQYLGACHPLLGILCLKIVKVALLVGSPNEEIKALIKEAANVLFVTHGTHHPLVKEELQPLLYEVSNCS